MKPITNELWVRRRVPTVIVVYQMWTDDPDTVTITLINGTAASFSVTRRTVAQAWRAARKWLEQ